MDELSLAEIEMVAKSIPDILTLSLTGGEPFLRSDLAEIAYIFSKNTRVSNMQIPTNGILTETIVTTTEEILKRCRNDIRILIVVSIDDLFDKHDVLRQVNGCFRQATNTIRQLKSLEKYYSNLKVGCNVTMNKDNQYVIIDLIDYVKNELSIEEIGVNIIRADVQDKSLKEISICLYEEIAKKLRKDDLKRSKIRQLSWIERILSARQYYGSLLLCKIFMQNKYLTPCYAGRLLAIIRENGDVNPCEILPNKMGNLREYNYDFKKLWFSAEAKKIRVMIDTSKCYCTYECAATLNMLFNYAHLFRIIKSALLRR